MATIVSVCTGNICRSPVGEILLQGYLGTAASVTSAGTFAHAGDGIPEPMRLALAADGIDGTGHIATQLTPTRIKEADLIVVMAAEHRRWVVGEYPAALKRTYLLSELAAAARMGLELPGDTVTERVKAIADAIPAIRPDLTDADLADVPDPYQRSQERYDESYRIIRDAVDLVGPWLRG